MSYTKKERELYNSHRDIVCNNLGIDKNTYNWFRRKGEILHKLNEDYCNGIENQYNDELCAETINLVENKAKKFNLYLFLQDDPRGATVYLSKEPINQTNYNNGSCIY